MARRPPRTLAITPRGGDRSADFADWIAALAAAGVEALQIRDKELPDRRLLELCRAGRRAAGERLSIVVNGRADIASAAELDGVHLPSTGLPVAAVRHLLGGEALIGRSTHRREEVERAFAAGADYVTFGPVYPTPSKAAYGPPPGVKGLQAACRVGGPVLALGGITMGRIRECLDAGAHGISAIRLFQDREALPALARILEEPS